MTATNIHILPAEPSTAGLPRLRSVTNDPAREYARRPGEVERLPDSIAALILSKKGFSKVGRNGIKVEGVAAKPLNFWHADSVTIQEKAGTNEKVLWVLNRLNPDVIHILKPSGEYVESIPLEGRVPWFDEAATKQKLGAKRRSQNRTVERLRLLHGSDSEAAADAAIANDTAMKSAVHTLPASAASTPAHARDRAHDRSQTTRQDLQDFQDSRNGPGQTISPRDRQSTPALSGPERIEPEQTHRAGNFPERQQSNLGGVRAVRREKSTEIVELPSRAEGRARSSARGAFGPSRTGNFEKADRIHEIQRHLEEQRNGHAQRVQTLARRVAEVTPEDLDDLTSGPEPECEPQGRLLAAAAVTCSEDDASDDIL